MRGTDWSLVWAGSVIGAAVLIGLILLGGIMEQSALLDDCKAFGAFRANGVVYSCAPRAGDDQKERERAN